MYLDGAFPDAYASVESQSGAGRQELQPCRPRKAPLPCQATQVTFTSGNVEKKSISDWQELVDIHKECRNRTNEARGDRPSVPAFERRGTEKRSSHERSKMRSKSRRK